MVAGDHRARLLAAHRRLAATHRRDQELIGGEHELGADALARRFVRRSDERAAAVELAREDGLGIGVAEALPGLGRGDERHRVAGQEVGAEVAQAHELADRVVAAVLLDAVEHLAHAHALGGEGGPFAAEQEAQRPEVGGVVDLVAVVVGGEPLRLDERLRHRRVVRAEVDRAAA